MGELLELIKGLLGIKLEFAKVAIQLLMLQGFTGQEITPERLQGMMQALQAGVTAAPTATTDTTVPKTPGTGK